MIVSDDGHILFIEPEKAASKEPVQDKLSAKMREAMKYARRSQPYFGVHQCVCGERSDAFDWILHTGQKTNSLAVHYLEYHRKEVPRSELKKVKNLPLPEVTDSVEASGEERRDNSVANRLSCWMRSLINKARTK